MTARTWIGLSLLLIGLLTLWPIPAQAPLSAATPFLCLPCGDEGVADLVLNLALFIPLGVALGLGGLRLPAAAAAAAATTATVELLQAVAVTGRDASVADMASNTAGAVLGWGIAGVRSRLLFPGSRLAASLAAAWTAGGIIAALVTGWSLPHSLRATTWYGQWAPQGDEREWFTGPVLAVQLGRRPLAHWMLPDSDRRWAELAQDTVVLAARVGSIVPPEERLRIVALADSAGRLITLSQRGRDLEFAVRTRASRIFLHSPVFRVENAMPPNPGDPVVVEGRYWRGWAGVQHHRYEVSTLDGWSLLLPAAQGTPAAIGLTVLWLAVLFAPVGFYGGRIRTGSWAVAPALLLLATPVAIAWLMGTPLPATWEVGVGATAALAGRVLSGVRT